MDDTGVLLVVGALVLGAVVGFLLCPKPVIVPYVNAGPDVSVTECCSTRLTCEGYNPSGGSLTYHWAAKDGKGSFNDASLLHPVYTAPSVCGCSDDIVLTLTATNEHGIQASDSMVVRVRDTVSCLPLERCRPITPAPCRVAPVSPPCAVVPVQHCPPHSAAVCVPAVPYCSPECPQAKPIVNHPPIANAGDDMVMTECTAAQLTCEGYDPDGDPVTYYWRAVGERGSFDNPRVLHPKYTAPAVDGCKARDYVFLSLTVTDNHGASAYDSLVVHVKEACPACCQTVPVPCCPPQVAPICTPVPCVPTPSCITQRAAKSINEGGSIVLHGTVCDPDDNVVRYAWTADKGTFDDPTSLNPTYYAPMTNACEGEYACITLTALDSCCSQGVDQLILHINNVNHLPIADAGGDITISGGTSVQLTCSASDPDGDALSYCWTTSCGGGCFSNPCTPHPVYTAPFADGCKQQDIVLTLTVTDACGASASDSMTAHVNPIVNTSPTVHADP